MNKLEKDLLATVGEASKDFDLLEPNDKIMVCMSGGKDSYAMAWLLQHLQKRLPFKIELVAVNLDQGHPGFEQHVITKWCDDIGLAHHMIAEDTLTIVKSKIPEGKTYCSLCSRLRRGILYDTAQELGCTKIALGHHRDDFSETLLLNLLFSGQISAMDPKLRSDDGRNVVIRPLMYCAEKDLIRFAEEKQFPILPCDLCGSQENLQRKQVKKLLDDLETRIPLVRNSVFASMKRVVPTHLLDSRWHLPDERHGTEAVLSALAVAEGGDPCES